MEHPVSTTSALDVSQIRQQFPVLHQMVNGHPLIYFDNAATTQKPRRVMDALIDFYHGYNANIHRGIHTLAEKATSAFEQTRQTAKNFVNARFEEEIIFVRGVTEAINLVAASYGRNFLEKGDEIIVSCLEHHANIVPWQWVCAERGTQLKVIPISENGDIQLDELDKLFSPRTKLVAICHASNSLGTINPVKEIISKARWNGAVVLVDGAQAGAHLTIDVQDLDCDFYCLSAHKMYGPTGVGLLYGKRELLNRMPPYQGGGEMIREVTFGKTTYNDLPYKFEAGTPNIADVIAFSHAMDFILEIGRENIQTYEHSLLQYATAQLSPLPFIRFVGTAEEKVGVISFIIEGAHHFDIGHMLDVYGIAVRTGHHCTQPLMQRMKIDGTTRVSLAVYNTKGEIDEFVSRLSDIIKFLRQ